MCERLANRADDLRAIQKPRHHAFAVRQVEIPQPLAQLGVGEAVMLFRRRGQALRENREPLGEDRKLARLRAAQLAVDADDVAQVEALGQLPIVAHLLLADEELNLARHVADVDELQLALVAMQHDAAGGANLRARHFAGALLGEPLAEIEIGAGRCQIGQRHSRPSCVVNVISPARARMSAMAAWSSNREPHGSWPSSAIRRSLSRRDDSQSPLDAAVAGWSVTVELMRVGARWTGEPRRTPSPWERAEVRCIAVARNRRGRGILVSGSSRSMAAWHVVFAV